MDYNRVQASIEVLLNQQSYQPLPKLNVVMSVHSQFGLNARKSTSSKFLTLRVSSSLCWSAFKTNRLEADLSKVFSVFPMKSLRSRFWTTLLSPCPDDPVIDLTAISTRRISTLFIAVKISSCMRFSTAWQHCQPLSKFFRQYCFLGLGFDLDCYHFQYSFRKN